MSEQAYNMAQNLDPSSDGRGVLQFKTGLMSIIKVLSSTLSGILKYMALYGSNFFYSYFQLIGLVVLVFSLYLTIYDDMTFCCSKNLLKRMELQ